jgi:hypothetical protein
MNANEIIVHREQRNRMRVIFYLFRKGVCQPGSDVQPVFDASEIEKRIQAARDEKMELKKAMASSTEKKPPSKRSRAAAKH